MNTSTIPCKHWKMYQARIPLQLRLLPRLKQQMLSLAAAAPVASISPHWMLWHGFARSRSRTSPPSRFESVHLAPLVDDSRNSSNWEENCLQGQHICLLYALVKVRRVYPTTQQALPIRWLQRAARVGRAISNVCQQIMQPTSQTDDLQRRQFAMIVSIHSRRERN